MKPTTEFIVEDWERILHALRFYCKQEEIRLASDNNGYREWSELSFYEALTRDIEYHIIGMK